MKRLKKISHEIEHGIYLLDQGEWISTTWEDILKKASTGSLIVYYGNTLCGVCKAFNMIWNSVAEAVAGKYKDVLIATVMCGWFNDRCDSINAARLFAENRIWGTPTIIAYCVNNGRVREVDRREEALSTHELVEFILDNRRRKC